MLKVAVIDVMKKITDTSIKSAPHKDVKTLHSIAKQCLPDKLAKNIMIKCEPIINPAPVMKKSAN